MASREERKGGGKILQRKPIVPRHARKKQDMLKAERERDTKSRTRVRSTSFPSLSGGVRDDAKWSSSTFSFFPLLPRRWKGRANEWAGAEEAEHGGLVVTFSRGIRRRRYVSLSFFFFGKNRRSRKDCRNEEKVEKLRDWWTMGVKILKRKEWRKEASFRRIVKRIINRNEEDDGAKVRDCKKFTWKNAIKREKGTVDRNKMCGGKWRSGGFGSFYLMWWNISSR